MFRIAGFARAVVVAALALGGQALLAQDPQQPARRDLLRKEGSNYIVAMGENEGLTLKEFIGLANRITGKNFTFNPTEFSGAAGGADQTITWLGPKIFKEDRFKETFFSFFQTMLYIRGFGCIVRGEGETEMIEIISIAGQKAREMASASRYVAVENLEEYKAQTGVQIITSVPLKHLNATAATNSLRPFFLGQAAGGTGGPQFGQVGNAKAILIQGFGPQVYAAYRILDLLDVPIDTLDLEFRVQKLDHQDAAELEQILNDVLNDPGRRQRAPAGAGASGAELPASQQQQMRIMPVPSQNALVLSGTPEQVLEALNLIARLDVPTEITGGDTHVVPLKNVLAKELEQTLREFINADVQAEQAVQAGAPGGGGAVRRQRKTVVYAHEESNSLLISGTASKYQALLKTIDELDRRQPQVLIECAVVELSTSTLNRLGVELGFIDLKNNDPNYARPFGFTSFGLSTFQDTNDDSIPDIRLPDFENPLQGVTGGIIGGEDFAIPVLINALAQDNKANIMSLPSVVVNNNENAKVTSSEIRPTQEVQQNNVGSQQGAGEDKEAGIELNISPSISSNNYLRLNVMLNVSRFLTPFDPSAVTAGVRTTRVISTQVTMPSGHTMVLGGVIEDQESDLYTGIPILKDIPLLGILFRSESRSKAKTNLYFFLTPHILNEDDFSDLAAISFRKKLEAAEYIGHRRIELIDPKWTASRAQTLEDPGATIEDLDRQGGFSIPVYSRPDRKPSTIKEDAGKPGRAGTQAATQPTTTGPTSPGRTNGKR